MKFFNLFESSIIGISLGEAFDPRDIESYIDPVIDHVISTYGDGFDWQAESETDFVDMFWDQIEATTGDEPDYDGISAAFERYPTLKQKYLRWLKTSWLEARIREFISVIVGTTHWVGDNVVLYRVITANSDWYPAHIHDRPVGVYWSHATNAADAHWGGDHSDMWKLRCHAPAQAIDWLTTLSNNVLNPHEAEIHLKSGTPVVIDQILLLHNNRWLEPNMVNSSYPSMKPQRMKT